MRLICECGYSNFPCSWYYLWLGSRRMYEKDSKYTGLNFQMFSVRLQSNTEYTCNGFVVEIFYFVWKCARLSRAPNNHIQMRNANAILTFWAIFKEWGSMGFIIDEAENPKTGKVRSRTEHKEIPCLYVNVVCAQ